MYYHPVVFTEVGTFPNSCLVTTTIWIKGDAYRFDIHSVFMPTKKRKSDMAVYKIELWHFQESIT